MRKSLTRRNVCLFLIMNFFQVVHLTFFSNFTILFVEGLIPMRFLLLYGASCTGQASSAHSAILDLRNAMFDLVGLAPLGMAVSQVLVWSPFSTRNETDHTGSLRILEAVAYRHNGSTQVAGFRVKKPTHRVGGSTEGASFLKTLHMTLV